MKNFRYHFYSDEIRDAEDIEVNVDSFVKKISRNIESFQRTI